MCDEDKSVANGKIKTPKLGGLSKVNIYVREYIDHVENGMSLREIAKRDGVHPSTVLRRIRKIEVKRDDVLLDDALARFWGKTKKTTFTKGVYILDKPNVKSYI